jgi:hypothetical protein
LIGFETQAGEFYTSLADDVGLTGTLYPGILRSRECIKPYRMKKIYVGLVALAVTCLVVSIGCRKNAPELQGSTVLSAETIAKDGSFMSLNEAISRFDPEYLVKVYGDKRPITELNAKSGELLIQLQKEPDNTVIQQQFADFYRFSSIAQLKEYSARISTSLKELDTRYDLKKTLLLPNGGALYAKARSLFIIDKYQQLKTGARQLNKDHQRRTDLWQEYVEAELSNFGELAYYNPYDQSFDPNVEMGGGGCTESCCWEWESCRTNARSNYWTNLWKFIGGGAIGSAAAGGAAASVVPFWGTVAGTVGGFIWGGSIGATLANLTYQNDLQVCGTNYLACLAKKREKQNP